MDRVKEVEQMAKLNGVSPDEYCKHVIGNADNAIAYMSLKNQAPAMYFDTKCPYCGEGQDINPDDGYGYDGSETYQQECLHCEKTFTFTTSIALLMVKRYIVTVLNEAEQEKEKDDNR